VPSPNAEPEGADTTDQPSQSESPSQAAMPTIPKGGTLAKLFDGKSSRPISVIVSVGIHALHLRQPNGDRLPDGLPGEWLTKKIQISNSGTPGLEIVELNDYDGLELHVSDAGLIERMLSKRRSRSVTDAFGRFIGKGWENVALVIIVVIALGMIFFFKVMPGIVENSVKLLPTSVDEAVGESILRGMDTSDIDPAASAYANAYMHHMGIDTSKNHAYVLQSSVMNAFALPGGHIILHSRMLDSMKRPGELAALLGHEYTHVEKRHSMQAIARSVAAYAFLAAIIGDVAGLSAVFLEAANSVGQLSYSRSLEAEADEIGAEKLVKAGYTTHEMVSLFQMLQRHQEQEKTEKEEKDGDDNSSDDQLAEILSSHPALDKRIA
jgi:hypothetical protein